MSTSIIYYHNNIEMSNNEISSDYYGIESDICENIIYDSLITIDFSGIYEAKINGEFRELVFTIKDNANNSNIIYKNVFYLLNLSYYNLFEEKHTLTFFIKSIND